MPKVSTTRRREGRQNAKVATPTGPEIIDQMTEVPTLDRYMDTDPNMLTDDDIWSLIEGQRRARAMFIQQKG